MHIARIITKNKKNINTLDFVEKTSELSAIDDSIPTLIIGKTNVISLYGDGNFSLIDRKIKDNVFWTYSKTEKRSLYEVDLERFNKLIVTNLLNKVKYVFFNVLTNPYTRIKSFIQYLRSNKPKVVYVCDKHVYINDGTNVVIGLSLADAEYIGIDSEKILSKIKENKANTVIYNSSFINRNTKRLLNDNKTIIPFLYFVKNT